MGKKSDDDAHAFRAAVTGVRPLSATPPPPGLAKRPPRPRKLKKSRRPESDAAGTAERGAGQPLLGSAVSVGAEDSLLFRRGGVQDQVMRRLRRGLYPIDGDLDLHGLVVARAWVALTEFLRASRDAGHRCVRIVHGKGYRSGTRGAVLKTAVNSWLRQCHDVIGFCSARALDGGAGAVYVLLRA